MSFLWWDQPKPALTVVPDANPDGGIGGLTPAEDAELSDLLNGPHKLCECGDPGCGSPIPKPGLRDV